MTCVPQPKAWHAPKVNRILPKASEFQRWGFGDLGFRVCRV